MDWMLSHRRLLYLIPVVSIGLFILNVTVLPQPSFIRGDCSIGSYFDAVEFASSVFFWRYARLTISAFAVIIACCAWLSVVMISFHKRTKQLIGPLVMLSVYLVCVAVWFVLFIPARVMPWDAMRISYLHNIQLALEIYHEDVGAYPIAKENSDSWWSLSTAMSPQYEGTLRNDPCAVKNPQHRFEYRSGDDGQAYVLRALMDDHNHPKMQNDIDGTVQGLECGIPGREIEYCVGSEMFE